MNAAPNGIYKFSKIEIQIPGGVWAKVPFTNRTTKNEITDLTIEKSGIENVSHSCNVWSGANGGYQTVTYGVSE